MLIATLLATLIQSSTSGTFHPAQGEPAPWSINQHHTLVWSGQPYIPMGLHVEGSLAAMESAIGAGATDLLIDLPANGMGWKEAVAFLESKGIRYLICIGSVAKPAQGVVVQPQTYRLSGLTEDQTVNFPAGDASSAWLVLAAQRDGSIAKAAKIPALNRTFSLPIETGGLEHLLLVYPEMTSLTQPDYWDEFDSHRDALLAAVAGAKFGPGFRGIVDPVGQTIGLYGKPKSFVPTSNAYRNELKIYLAERYRNLETAARAWSIRTNDLETLDDLARLVPLWSGNRGVKMFWDPVRSMTYNREETEGSAWQDIDRVIQAAAVKRFDRLVAAIKQKVDVPIVQTWQGWRGPYELANPNLTGIGIEASGSSPSEWLVNAAPGASSLLRWTKPGWLIATDLKVPRLSDAAAELGAAGVRGFFGQSSPDTLAELKGLVSEPSLSQWSPAPLFFPESATNPAAAQRLPNGNYWLPSPLAGNRLELGPSFSGYRYDENGEVTVVLRSNVGPGRFKLRSNEAKDLTFRTLDGADPKPKLFKLGVEVNLSEVPVIIKGGKDIPIPEYAYQQTISRFMGLEKLADGMKSDVTQEKYNFKEAARGFDRIPSNFAAMRRNYWLATSRLAPYLWVEAETCRQHNMSDKISLNGLNSGAALWLDSIGPIDPRGIFASYEIPVRTLEDQEIWIAARIPRANRGDVVIRTMGTDFPIASEPVQAYGPGIAWYKVGTTKFSGAGAKLEILVRNSGPVDMTFDTIFIAPAGMTPNGALPPEIVN
ncbi:MAG: hypothetical protein ABL949_01435 [Fimbriimonadaceae bacterium]